MKSQKVFNLIGIIILFISSFSLNILEVSANNIKEHNMVINVNSGGAGFRAVTLPKLYKIKNITVDNGTVSWQQGNSLEQIIVEVDNGEVKSGYYEPSHTKYVTGQLSQNYSDSEGYVGSLSIYVQSGSYTPAESKYISGHNSGSAGWGDWCYGRGEDGRGEVAYKPQPKVASSINYNSGGFQGTLSLNIDYYGYHQDGNSHCFELPMTRWNANWSYSGTVTKPAIDTRVYRYQGDVVRPAVDTRQYIYNVRVEYEIDEDAPYGSFEIDEYGDKRVRVIADMKDDKIGLHTSAFRYGVEGKDFSGWKGSTHEYTGLQPNTYYKFKLHARDRLENQSEHSVSGLTLAEKPSLTFTHFTTNSITVNIDKKGNNNSVRYDLERSDEEGNFDNAKVLLTKELNTFIVEDVELEEGKRYWYRVRAWNDEDKPTEWATFSKFTKVGEPDMKVSTDRTNAMDLEILPLGNPEGTLYHIERASNVDFTSGKVVVSNWQSDLKIEDKGLVAGTEYFYRIKARNGDGDVTEVEKVYWGITVPPAPVLSSVVVGDYVDEEKKKDLKVKWQTTKGAREYSVYVDGVWFTDTNSLEHVVTGLGSNRRYEITVTGKNESGESEFSNKIHRYTRSHSLDKVDIVDMGEDYFTFDLLDYGIDEELAEYRFEVRPLGSTNVVRSDSWSNKVEGRTISGLNVGTQYELWVDTRNKENVANGFKKIIDEFVLNRPPELKLELGKSKYSGVTGFNELEIRGELRDLDIIPRADILSLYYTLKDDKGNIISGYNKVKFGEEVTDGVWKNISYNLPLSESLGEGYYRVEVIVEDELGESDIGSKDFLIDRTEPVGSLRKVNGDKEYSIELEIYEEGGEIAGLLEKPYVLERRVNNGGFEKGIDFFKDKLIGQYDLESNTKYSYRVNIFDQVGQSTKTNLVEFISSPRYVDYGFIENEPSTVYIDFEKGLRLGDGIEIEVRRSGSLVAVLGSGDRFTDKYLDFEREYVYELRAVGKDEFGDRLESLPISFTVETGSPLLTLELDNDFDSITNEYVLNRTIFDKEVLKSGFVYNRSGGNGILNWQDDLGVWQENIRISPLLGTPFKLKGFYFDGFRGKLGVSVSLNGIKQEAEVGFRVGVKYPQKDKLSAGEFEQIFK